MSFRLRQSFRLWRGASLGYSIPLFSRRPSGKKGCGCLSVIGWGFIIFMGMAMVSAIVQLITGGGSSSSVKKASSNAPTENVQSSGTSSITKLPAGYGDSKPPNSLTKLDPKALYVALQLGERGFEYRSYDRDKPPYWVYRKTEEDREYTTVLLGGSDRVQAITAEVVTTNGAIAEQSKTFFLALADHVLLEDQRDEAKAWINEILTQDGTDQFGDVLVTITHQSNNHRRITFQAAP